ncbi:MAG TPA: uracil-DNA glycosylase family protein [Rhizomicrobium sp.]
MRELEKLLAEIRACRICEAHLPHGPRPVLRASATAKLCIVAQAPGIRVHESGLSFNDPSGDRLREWLKLDRDMFYDETRVAIIGMGFCFPGHDANGGDKPPRGECARAWHERLFALLPPFELTLLVGTYAHKRYLATRAKASMTETVKAWRDYAPSQLPLPHPSWRNSAWLKRNSWFAEDLLPDLRKRVAKNMLR